MNYFSSNLTGTHSQEYMTLKRYQNESNIPERFKTAPGGESTAAERALYRTRDTPATASGTVSAAVPHMFRWN